jgi:hypothetical protein
LEATLLFMPTAVFTQADPKIFFFLRAALRRDAYLEADAQTV